MTAHSRLAPSSAFRWVPCPASVRLSEQFPALYEDPSAAEGEAVHWAGYSMLRTHTPVIGETAPNGVQLTEEMLDAALLWHNTVFEYANKCGGLTNARLEERVAIAGIHPEMSGTPDCDIWDAANRTIYVLDLKYGHRNVGAFECWQLVSYVHGRLEEYGAQDDPDVKVGIVVVQPRSYSRFGPVKTWETTVGHLQSRMWPMLRESAKEALEATNPRYAVGAHCRDCPGRYACPTLARNSQAAMDYASSSMPIALAPADLGLELLFARRAQMLLDARLVALEQQAEANLRGATGQPGWGLEPGRGSAKWAVEADEVEIFGGMCGVSLMKPATPVTPAQAREILKKKGLDPSVIESYSQHIPGAMKLVPVEETLAHRAFQKGNR